MNEMPSAAPIEDPRPRRIGPALRVTLALSGVVFVGSSLFNFGLRIAVGYLELAFPAPILQAGVGEVVFGTLLLAAAWTRRTALAWIAAGLGALGIAFGLASPRVVGAARDVHALLIPLVGAAFALLALEALRDRRRPRRPPPPRPPDPRRSSDPLGLGIAAFMAATALAFAAASVVHFGLAARVGPLTIRDPFPGAAVPELVIAAALAIGAAAIVGGYAGRWRTALSSAVFGLLLTTYGLTVTLASSRGGDVAYHVVVLAALAAIVGLLLHPRARRRLGGADAGAATSG